MNLLRLFCGYNAIFIIAKDAAAVNVDESACAILLLGQDEILFPRRQHTADSDPP